MKKIFLLSAAALTLAACGSNSEVTEENEDEITTEEIIVESDDLTEEFDEGIDNIEFGEVIELEQVDIKPIDTVHYPEGVGGHDENMFEFVFEVTNKTNELASPTYLSFWNTSMVQDKGATYEPLEERLPIPEYGLTDEQAERMNRGDLKPGQTIDVSVWYGVQSDDPIYLYIPETEELVPINL